MWTIFNSYGAYKKYSHTTQQLLTVFCDLQFGVGGSKASFTPFVDPRVYQTSPSENDDENSAAGKENLRKL